ncbi:MAG: dienelactone hydrolase family protein [Cyanobacteria bacterium REEB67]|nr:dienelactone hydrolase family protein [Cyanobacteria bacterium REEB67]
MGQDIKLKAADGKEYSAYQALPEGGRGPGLIVIQEIFGVNSHIRQVADIYAALGFVAVAPDVFFRIKPGLNIGYSEQDVQEGFGYYGNLDWEQATNDLASTARAMKEMDAVIAKVGSVGYCMGGNLSFRLAAKNAVDAAVSYYPGGIDGVLDQAANLRTPLLVNFGEKDTHIPMTVVEKVKEALTEKRNTDVLVYDAEHGFNCDQRASYDRTSAMIALARSNMFLHKYLG